MSWSSDGTGLFVSGFGTKGFALLYLDRDSREKMLLQSDAWIGLPLPSPDSKHFAFGKMVSEDNAAMLENF